MADSHNRIILARGQSANTQTGSLAGQFLYQPTDYLYNFLTFRAVFATSNPSFSASVRLYNLTSDSELCVFSSSISKSVTFSRNISEPTGILEVTIASENPAAHCILGSAELTLTGALP